jgi:hypothetical protein
MAYVVDEIGPVGDGDASGESALDDVRLHLLELQEVSSKDLVVLVVVERIHGPLDDALAQALVNEHLPEFN